MTRPIAIPATGEPKWIANCHCESCRRATGAPLTTYAGFRAERFAYVSGEPVRFQTGSEPMGRWFDVYALRVGRAAERRVAILFTDISAEKAAHPDRRTRVIPGGIPAT